MNNNIYYKLDGENIMKSIIDEVDIIGDIEPGRFTLQARYNKKIIGSIQFQGICYEDELVILYPVSANVDKEYQRKGVATKIIQEANKYAEVRFVPDCGTSGNSDEIHYANEGFFITRKSG